MRTADEIVAIARDAGHVLALEYRDPPAGYPDAKRKWWCSCACGWSTPARYTRTVVTSSGGNHLARMAAGVVEDQAAEERRRRVAGYLTRTVGPTA